MDKICKRLIKSRKKLDRTISKHPITPSPLKEKTNLNCGCGRNVGKDDAYFIRLEPGEKPEIFCEMCISINV